MKSKLASNLKEIELSESVVKLIRAETAALHQVRTASEASVGGMVRADLAAQGIEIRPGQRYELAGDYSKIVLMEKA